MDQDTKAKGGTTEGGGTSGKAAGGLRGGGLFEDTRQMPVGRPHASVRGPHGRVVKEQQQSAPQLLTPKSLVALQSRSVPWPLLHPVSNLPLWIFSASQPPKTLPPFPPDRPHPAA
jgi:hypothetical protein